MSAIYYYLLAAVFFVLALFAEHKKDAQSRLFRIPASHCQPGIMAQAQLNSNLDVIPEDETPPPKKRAFSAPPDGDKENNPTTLAEAAAVATGDLGDVPPPIQSLPSAVPTPLPQAATMATLLHPTSEEAAIQEIDASVRKAVTLLTSLDGAGVRILVNLCQGLSDMEREQRDKEEELIKRRLAEANDAMREDLILKAKEKLQRQRQRFQESQHPDM